MPVSEPALSQAEARGRGIAAVVRQVDELRAELRMALETIEALTARYTVEDVVEVLDSLGVTFGSSWASDAVFDYAWNHPDWFRSGAITVEGAENVMLDADHGLVFTTAGFHDVVAQFAG